MAVKSADIKTLQRSTTQGTLATIQPGSLLILDSSAKIVATLTKTNLLDSPGGRTAPPLNGTGAVIFQVNHLRGPLALVLVPNGDLITSNGDAVNPM
jgi:hypothetical protein